MKRGKIMLAAIAVVAAVGGLLAFKAQRFAHKNVWCATIEPTTTCKLIDFKTTNVGNFVTTPCELSHAALGITTTSYYTTSTCPTPLQASATITNVQ